MLETVPPNDPEIERAVLSAMIAWPEAAQVAVAELDISTFYTDIHKTAFDRLSVQFAHNGVCDSDLLRADLGLDFVVSLESGVLRASGPSTIHDYCRHLRDLEAKRKAMTAAGELLSGKPLAEVAKTVADLAAVKNKTNQCDVEELHLEIEAEIHGIRRAVAFQNWPVLSSTQMLLPGTVSVLCGSPGVSKSFFAIQPVWEWHEAKECCAALELESGATFHLRRVLAQMAGNANLTRASWCRRYPQEAMNAIEEFGPRMNRLKPVIQSPVNGDMPTCEYLLAWLKGQCQQRGARVLVIDPITMMQTPVQGFKDHERFVAESKNIMAKYGASLIVVTHPKRGMPGTPILPCLENLPNSSAYERFCDTILWLEWIEESSDEFVALLAPATSTHKTYNRVLHTLKVRLDVNPKKIGYVFDANTLRHVECGKFVE